MWEQEKNLMSMFWPNKKLKPRDANLNWYFKLKETYIISIVWTANLNKWQVCVSDKKKIGKYTHRFWEEDLGIAKLKGSIKALELGWEVDHVV